MQKLIYPVIRYVFGAGMAFFGINNLFHLLPPHTFPGEAGSLMLAFEEAGYIIPAVGISQLILGMALLMKRYVPFALLLFAPMVVNILLFHLFLDLSGIAMALPVVGVTIYLFVVHHAAFIHLLRK